MARRPAWTVANGKVVGSTFEFEWNSGLSVAQKQRNIVNLHKSIKTVTGQNALEISSKGTVEIGNALSAFHLSLKGIKLENIFQSAKKYTDGGPFTDLLFVTPVEAKRDMRHKTSGQLVAFQLGDVTWPLEPRTAFYDYIYTKVMVLRYGTDLDLDVYDWFTDIEFNPSKSINCQARAVALYKLLQSMDAFNILSDKEGWLRFHSVHVVN